MVDPSPAIVPLTGRAPMRCRDHIALTLPSFLLRLTLAITFLWAGTAKLAGTTTAHGDNAARLANLGVSFIQESAEDPDSTLPDEPINPLPDSEIDTNPDTELESEPANEEPATDPVTIRNIAFMNSPAVGSDYPEPVSFRRVYGIALLLDHAVNPNLTDDSQTVPSTMPSWMGTGSMPVYAAWATAITELACGFLLLLGLLTRLSAISLTIVMLVALWTTNIGPAALQSSDAILGFIPAVADPWDPSSYSVLLWQLALIVMSLSVALLGAGPLSLDRMFFRPSRRDPYVSGESKPNPPKPSKPDPQAQPHDRTEFDRAPPPQSNPTP